MELGTLTRQEPELSFAIALAEIPQLTYRAIAHLERFRRRASRVQRYNVRWR